jgi:hypothetical protein
MTPIVSWCAKTGWRSVAPSETAPPAALFFALAPGFGAGQPAPAGWAPLAEQPLVVLVGLTGAGKTATLAALTARGAAFHLLPDRRTLTDGVILPAVRSEFGAAAPPLSRLERFAYTRHFRDRYPGGMAYVLAGLWVDPAHRAAPLVFDSLRGADEVAFAARVLPRARFLVLEAPDEVRLRRLLDRADPFDWAGVDRPARGAAAPPADRLSALGVPDADVVLGDSQQRALLALVAAGQVALEDLRAMLAVVVEERRNYDPDAARAALLTAAPARTRVVDTAALGPEEVAAALAELLGAGSPRLSRGLPRPLPMRIPPKGKALVAH